MSGTPPPAQPQLYSTETGEAIQADPKDYGALVSSGKAAFLKGTQIPVVDSFGRPATISSDDFHQFLADGGQYEPPEMQAAEAAKEKYGNQPVRAQVEAGLRGLTAGISDVAFRAAGVPAEDLKGRKDNNFTTPTEIGGAIAPLIASFGASALPEAGGAALRGAAELAPTSFISRAGTGVADATANMVGSGTAKGIAGKIIQRVAPSVAGGAVEGAAYGLGNTISEAALGDTDNIAEKAAANIGGGFLLGGAGGALIGALFPHVMEPAAAKGAPLVSELDRAPQTVEHATEAAVNSSLLNESEREAFQKGMTSKSSDAEAIRKAGAEFGVEVFPEQTSNSPAVKRISSILDEDPTPVAVARRQMKEQAIDKVQNTVASMMGEGLGMTEEQVGQQMAKQLSDKVEAYAQPSKDLYKITEEKLPFVPVEDSAKEALGKTLQKMDRYNIPGSIAQKTVDYVIDTLPAMKTAKDIISLGQELTGRLSATAAPGERYVAQTIKSKLEELAENSAVRAAKAIAAQTADPAERFALEQAAAAIPAARQEYSAFRDKLNPLAKELGRKRIGGLADFQEFVQEMKPHVLLKKMFDPKDSAFLKFMKSQFPDEANLLIQFRRTQMLDAAKKAESLAPIFKEVGNLSPEVRSLVLSKEELNKLEMAEKYLKNIKYGKNPKFGNPSGSGYTAHASNAFGMVTSAMEGAAMGGAMFGPVGAVVGGAAGAAYKSANLKAYAMKRFIETGADPAAVSTLEKLENVAQKTSKAITSSVRGLVDVGASAVPAIGTKLLRDNDDTDRNKKREQFKKTSHLLVTAASNPGGIVDRAGEAVAPIAGHAPNVANAIAQKASIAPMFLYSKMPKNPLGANAFVGPKDWHPSDAELNKFNKYVEAVDSPLEVLKKLKTNQLSTEHVEALATVYPSLYREIQSKVMEELPKLKEEMPYQKKLQLGILMHQPLDQTMTPNFIAQMQAMHMQAQQQEAQKQVSEKAGKALHYADNAKSGTEAVLTRA